MSGASVGAAAAGVSTTGGVVGVGVGRGAKLPQARVGPSQISETAIRARNFMRWLRIPRVGGLE
jgi:hypothetical protein